MGQVSIRREHSLPYDGPRDPVLAYGLDTACLPQVGSIQPDLSQAIQPTFCGIRCSAGFDVVVSVEP